MIPYTLYQFPLSHYCEKVRWALDYKGLPYRLANLVPGPHVVTIRLKSPKTTVPVLTDGKRVIQDSTDIITWLDETHPEPALTPANLSQAKEVLEVEEFADREIGIHLRRFFYAHVLHDAGLAKRLLLAGAPSYGRALYFLAFPLVRSLMRQGMNITQATGLKSQARLEEALEKFNRVLVGRKFLVGGQFTRADLTVASLLAPLCLPPEHDFDWPAESLWPAALRKFRQDHIADRVVTWVLETYADKRNKKA